MEKNRRRQQQQKSQKDSGSPSPSSSSTSLSSPPGSNKKQQQQKFHNLSREVTAEDLLIDEALQADLKNINTPISQRKPRGGKQPRFDRPPSRHEVGWPTLPESPGSSPSPSGSRGPTPKSQEFEDLELGELKNDWKNTRAQRHPQPPKKPLPASALGTPNKGGGSSLFASQELPEFFPYKNSPKPKEESSPLFVIDKKGDPTLKDSGVPTPMMYSPSDMLFVPFAGFPAKKKSKNQRRKQNRQQQQQQPSPSTSDVISLQPAAGKKGKHSKRSFSVSVDWMALGDDYGLDNEDDMAALPENLMNADASDSDDEAAILDYFQNVQNDLSEDEMDYWQSRLAFQQNLPEMDENDDDSDSSDSDYYGRGSSQKQPDSEDDISEEEEEDGIAEMRQPERVVSSTDDLSQVKTPSSKIAKRSSVAEFPSLQNLAPGTDDKPEAVPNRRDRGKAKALNQDDSNLPSVEKVTRLMKKSSTRDLPIENESETDSDSESGTDDSDSDSLGSSSDSSGSESHSVDSDESSDLFDGEGRESNEDFGENYAALMRDYLQNPSSDEDNDTGDDKFNSLRRAIENSMIGRGRKRVASSSDIKFNAIVNGIFGPPPKPKTSKRGSFKERLRDSSNFADGTSSPPHKFSKILLKSPKSPHSQQSTPSPKNQKGGKHKKALAYARQVETPVLKYDKLIRRFIVNPQQQELTFPPNMFKKEFRTPIYRLTQVYNIATESIGTHKKQFLVMRKTALTALPDRSVTEPIVFGFEPSPPSPKKGKHKKRRFVDDKPPSKASRKRSNNNNNDLHESKPAVGAVVGGSAAPIGENNIGNKLLQKLGWTPGMTLGANGTGIKEPIEVIFRSKRLGLGID